MSRFSIAFQTDKPLADYGPLARRAEELGFDGVSAYNDLMFQPAWFPLLEMARATGRVHLGPAAVNPFLCHPVHLAGQAALLDEASGGRAYLGIARGSWLDSLGLRPERPVRALREAIQLIRHLWSGKEEPCPGEVFRLSGRHTLHWRLPEREIPILLGSWGKQTIRACLPLIREVKLGGTANSDVVAHFRRLIDSGARGERIGLVVGSVSVVDDDAGRARQLARQEVALYLPVLAKLDPGMEIEPELITRIQSKLRERDGRGAGLLVPDRLLERLALAGSPAQIVRQCLELLDAGADRIEFGTPHGIVEEHGMDLLGKRVLPILRRG